MQTSYVGRGLVLCCCGLAGAGCSRGEQAPPFVLGSPILISSGDPATFHKGRPALAITLPIGPQRIGRGDRIPLKIEVTLASGAGLPIQIDLRLVDHRQHEIKSVRAVPESVLGEGRYLLSGVLTAPDRPGRYTASARAVDLVQRLETSQQTGDGSSRLTESAGLEVVVQ